MKALCWTGVNKLGVESVEEPKVLNSHDAIVKVTLTAACGSDLHLLGGYIPGMRAGDVLGHEFLGEIVETGSGVTRHRVGDRVVVSSFIACGRCSYCKRDLWSLCDNGNPNPGLTETLWGAAPGGCFGYSHLMGGWAGSHAEYIRVPYVDHGAFRVPDGVSDERAVFASDAAPTGWMGADLGGVKPGDVVAVWGAGGVGQMAARAAILLGAERVVVIDRYPERLRQVTEHIGAETLDYTSDEVLPALKELSGGRGPDVCIEAVGMEAHSTGPDYLYDQVKQQLRLQTDRPTAVREAIHACRKGGSVFVLGVFGALVDKFPLGAVMNKGLTLRGAQQHGQRYIPMLLERMAAGELTTEHLATHVLPLAEGPQGYAMFKEKTDGCVRAVFRPLSTTMPEVLVVQHSADDPSGLVGHELLAAGCTIDLVRCHLQEEQPRSLSGYAGLVVLGGDMGAYDDADYPWLTRTKSLLREAVEHDVATLAVCLGHQLLAVAAGGEVARAPSPQRGLVPVGRSAAAGDDPLFEAFGDRDASAIHWNNDLVVTAPRDSVLLASSGAGIQALRLRSRVYGVQFHPEVDLETVTGWADHDVAAGHLSPEEARDRLAEIAAAATEQEKQWSAFADRFARLLRDKVPLTRGSMSRGIGG